MGRKLLPTLWKKKEDRDLSASPQPARTRRGYNQMLRDGAGQIAVTKAATKLIEAETEREIALGKLENVDVVIETNRQRDLLALDITKQKREAIAVGGRNVRKQITKGEMPDGVAEALELGREDYSDD